jgi:hypothetical protein
MGRSRALPVLAFVAAVAALSGTSTAHSQAARASLRLISDSPTTLRGAGFQSREHVRLVVVGDHRAGKNLVATAAGGFVARMPGVDANACRGFSATAVGDQGTRAWFKRAPGLCPYPGPA